MNVPMKIAIMTSPLSLGSGISKHVKLLSEGLVERGHRVFLVCKRTPYSRGFVPEPTQYYWIHGDQNQKKVMNAVKDIIGIRSLFMTEGINLVHSHHRWLAFLARIATTGTGIITIWTDHSELSGKKIATRFLSDFFVAVSLANKQRMERYFNIPSHRIRTIYNAVPPIGMPSYRETLGYKQAPKLLEAYPLIVAVGKLVELKGFRYLLEAVASLGKKYPAIGCVIAGSGENLDHLEKHASTLGIRQRVVFPGLVEDISAVVHSAHVFVSASISEGMPLNIIEAMSAGKAIVATAVGGVPEIITSGVNGLLVQPADSNALATAIELAFTDPSYSSTLGQNARSTYQKLLSVPTMMNSIEALYVDALS